MSLEKYIKTRKDFETKLYTIIYKYQLKYIYYIFEKHYDDNKQNNTLKHLYPDFQKHLIKISQWSDDSINKEYNRFLIWCKKKYNLSENELQKILDTIITLFIKVMINKSNVIVEGILEKYTLPKFSMFFYKCLKKIARKFYENPKSITMENEISNKIPKNDLLEIIKNTVYNLLPIEHIMSILEFQDEDENKNESSANIKYNYDFDKETSSDSSEAKTCKKIIVEKVQSECSLKYISSEEFNKEYCKSESEKHTAINEDAQLDDENLKHVRIKKIKNNVPFYYKKSKNNELNEYFFDE